MDQDPKFAEERYSRLMEPQYLIDTYSLLLFNPRSTVIEQGWPMIKIVPAVSITCIFFLNIVYPTEVMFARNPFGVDKIKYQAITGIDPCT